MNKLFLLISLLLFSGVPAARAQHRWRPPHPSHRQVRYQPEVRRNFQHPSNIVSLDLGAGGLAGYGYGGLGLTYERFLGAPGNFSVSVPLFLYWGADGKAGEPDHGETRNNINGFFVAPALLFHFFGNGRRGDVGLGIGAALGTFKRKEQYFYYTSGPKITWHQTPLVAPLAVVNLNFHSYSSFVFGLHAGIGPVLSDTGPDISFSNGNDLNGNNLLVQFGIRLGGGW